MSYVATGWTPPSKTTWTPSPAQQMPGSAGTAPLVPKPGGVDMPVASIGGLPWIIPVLGVVAIGGFIYYRRRKRMQAQKGPTP